MDKVTEEVIRPQSDSELTSPLSPKRPKTDYTVTKGLCGNGLFNSSEAWTSQKRCLSPSNLQKTDSLIFTVECGRDQHKNPSEEPQDNTLNVTHLATLHCSGTHSESSEVCFVSAERDEKHSVTETVTLNPYLRDNTDGSPPPFCINIASLPNCEKLEKDKKFDNCCLFSGNDDDDSQVRSDVSQLQAVSPCSNQADCTSEDVVQDTGLCNTGNQLAQVMETNQKREEPDFSDCILLSMTEDKSPISSRDFADPNPLYSNLSVNLTEYGKNEKQKSELWICETGNVSVCDVKTKGQVNENNMSKTPIYSAECAERSVLSNVLVLDTNIAVKNVSCEVNKDIEADHSAETLVASKISQEPAEGDNDADAFSVIDPAICSEIDEVVEGMLYNSESTAGIKLPSLPKTCNVEAALRLCCNISSSQVSFSDQAEEFNRRSGTQQCKNENVNTCQSYTGPQAHSVTNTDDEANCQSSPRSSPVKPLPAEVGGIQKSHNTEGQLKELGQSSCFAVSLDHIKTQEVEYLQSETDKANEAAGINRQKEAAQFLKDASNEEGNLEKTLKSAKKLQLQNEQDKKDTFTSVCVSGRTEDETQKRDSKLQCVDGEQVNELESLCDKRFCPDIHGKDVTSKGQKKGGVMNVGKEIKTNGCENSQMCGNSKDNRKNRSSLTIKKTQDRTVREEPCDDGISEWVERSRFTFCNVDDSELWLSCVFHYQHRSEISMPFRFPSASDAVVPCQPHLGQSENALSGSTAMKCCDIFSPSAFTLCDHVLGGFDTFEKIKLTLDDDDDDDAGLGNMLVHTSLPEEMLKTPRQQLHQHLPKAVLDIHKKLSEEEEEGGEEEGKAEMERLECHSENMANRFVSSDSLCNDAPNFTSADVVALTWPEQQPNCGSAHGSSEHTDNESNPQSESHAAPHECDGPPSDLNNNFEFEMKERFDRVLKELRLFFDISRNDFASDCRPSSPELCVPGPLESNISKSKEHLSNADLECHRDSPPDEAAVDQSLEMCGADAVVSLPAVSDSEQEVPLNRNLCQEPPMDSAEKHREHQEDEGRKVKMWSPSFMYPPLLEQLSHRPPEQHRRLAPLKTCTRPIRIGLSKRAKTKQLHRSHPYK